MRVYLLLPDGAHYVPRWAFLFFFGWYYSCIIQYLYLFGRAISNKYFYIYIVIYKVARIMPKSLFRS
jgi:hypothetical protein